MPNPAENHFTRIIDWIEGRLNAEEIQALVSDLENGDPASRADLDWARRFIRIREEGTYGSPPASVRENLKARFSEYAAANKPPTWIERLAAQLTFDSRTQFAAAGLRSAAREGQEHQLHYQTYLAEIALSLLPDEPSQRVDIAGQIFPKGEHPAETFSIQILDESDKEVDIARSDDLGEFEVRGLPHGRYRVFIATEGAEIVISPLEI